MSPRRTCRPASSRACDTWWTCCARSRASRSLSSTRRMWCAIRWCSGSCRRTNRAAGQRNRAAARPSRTGARREGVCGLEARRAEAGGCPWAPPRAELARWAAAALGARSAGRELGVALVGAAESRRLNARFRGRDKPTNVLSFPPAPLSQPSLRDARALGGLVVEARAQDKTLRAHWAHLIVHGTLHLAGYDHERAADARRMERREIAVLRRLGFSNPYES